MRKARLKPEAKKPPKGATNDAKMDMMTACHIILDTLTSRKEGTIQDREPNCRRVYAGHTDARRTKIHSAQTRTQRSHAACTHR